MLPALPELREKLVSFHAPSNRVYLVFSSEDAVIWEPLGSAEQEEPGNYRFTDDRISERMRLFKVLTTE